MELNEATQRGENPLAIQRAEAARATMTLDKAHHAYIAAIRREDRKKLRPRTINDKQGIYDRDIGPRLSAKLLSELAENDCWDAVYDKAKASRYRANKMAGAPSYFLKWYAEREGRMEGIELAAPPAPTLNSNGFDTEPAANQRFLDEPELCLWLRALTPEPLDVRRNGRTWTMGGPGVDTRNENAARDETSWTHHLEEVERYH